MIKKESFTISIILPTFNETEIINECYERIVKILDNRYSYEIIFVDDNSSDGTINKIKNISKKDSNIKYIIMSRRFGHQICLKAGLDYSSGDCIILMDSDLQHPPEYIPKMVQLWLNGSDIVVMKRNRASHNNKIRRVFENIFYNMITYLSDSPIYKGFSNFALLDKNVVNVLKKFTETKPFLRGFIGVAGYNVTQINFDEKPRSQGKSHYNLFSRFGMAINSIVSFSEKPLYLSIYIGFVAVCISFVYLVYVIYQKIVFGFPVMGWASIMIIQLFIGGIILMSNGVQGIYISHIFLQTKQRPLYIIKDTNYDSKFS